MALCATALLPARTPAAVIVSLAAIAGVATPPLGACTRTLFAAVLPDRQTVESAYRVDATASELAWVCAPLALAIGALVSDGAALALGALVLLVATIGVAAQPASVTGGRPPYQRIPRRLAERASDAHARPRPGCARRPVPEPSRSASPVRRRAGEQGIAAPLLGLWGAGSLIGGVLLARLGARHHSGSDLVLLLGALAIGHAGLSLAAGSVYTLGCCCSSQAQRSPPRTARSTRSSTMSPPEETMTEAFAWLDTAVAVGGAIGAATAGALVQTAGAPLVFALAGATGLAALAAATRLRSPDPGGSAVSVSG